VKRERRFQFSLRKMLLWTAVVAIGFALISDMGADPLGHIIFGSWAVVVGVIRIGIGHRWSASMSFVIALCVSFAYCRIDDAPLTHFLLTFPVMAAVAFGVFMFVETAYQAVDWLDKSPHSPEDEEQP